MADLEQKAAEHYFLEGSMDEFEENPTDYSTIANYAKMRGMPEQAVAKLSPAVAMQAMGLSLGMVDREIIEEVSKDLPGIVERYNGDHLEQMALGVTGASAAMEGIQKALKKKDYDIARGAFKQSFMDEGLADCAFVADNVDSDDLKYFMNAYLTRKAERVLGPYKDKDGNVDQGKLSGFIIDYVNGLKDDEQKMAYLEVGKAIHRGNAIKKAKEEAAKKKKKK